MGIPEMAPGHLPSKKELDFERKAFQPLYLPSDVAKKEVRLLQVDPAATSDSEDPIRCTFITVALCAREDTEQSHFDHLVIASPLNLADRRRVCQSTIAMSANVVAEEAN